MMTLKKRNCAITILGLGPGEIDLITREAWQILKKANEIYLRTHQHPTVSGFPKHLQAFSFDNIYETSDNFDEVYQKITEEVIKLGKRKQGVIYAVPGDPFVAEITTKTILKRANEEGLSIRVVHGMSFIEPTLGALALDPFPKITLVDALELSQKHISTIQPDSPILIAQIYSNQVASDVKITLATIYPDEYLVKMVHAAGTKNQIVEDIKLYEIDRSLHLGLLSSLFVPPLAEGASFESLLELVAHLRSQDGCPWDREQTHRTLRQYLLEETHELLAALDENNISKVCEELGDLLLQIYLHAEIAHESGEFNITDVLNGIYKKIINRHPHVFGDVIVEDSQMVLRNWEYLKIKEREAKGREDESLIGGLPTTSPALSQADQIQKRVARVGFDWKNIEGVYAKVFEELAEIKNSVDISQLEDEIGDLLFAVTNLARWHHVDAESALRMTNARFRRRFRQMEKIAKSREKQLQDFSIEELEEIWQEIKKF